MNILYSICSTNYHSGTHIYIFLYKKFFFMKYVEAPWLWRPLGNCPACPCLNPALCGQIVSNSLMDVFTALFIRIKLSLLEWYSVRFIDQITITSSYTVQRRKTKCLFRSSTVHPIFFYTYRPALLGWQRSAGTIIFVHYCCQNLLSWVCSR